MKEEFYHTSIDGVDLIKPSKNLNLYIIHNLRELIDKLEALNRKKYIFDFKDVEFIDSTCLGFLIQTNLKLKKENLAIKFININNNFQHIFHVSGLTGELFVFENLEKAINSNWSRE